jgi:Big-like domain-containing protein/calcineurin-like phosphoesterase family protein
MSGIRRAFLNCFFVAIVLVPVQPGAVPPLDLIDSTPPTVAITKPVAGATVSGNVSVEAGVSDNVLATTVEYLIDGTLRATGLALYPRFAWDTTTVPNGSHAISAKATDEAGNVSSSAVVSVIVSNPDTMPPTAPGNLTATAPLPNRVVLNWTASSDDFGVASYEVSRGGSPIGSTSSTSYTDSTVSGGSTYLYVVRALDAAGNKSGPSNTATVTTPTSVGSFSFAAGGDHGANARTEAGLNALDSSGVGFYLALGDMDYDETSSDAAWCDYVSSRLPTLGPSFPFQLVSGNHEEQGGPDGYILNHAACLPDRLNSTLGPNNQYAAEYYFDYPAGAPLVRVVMIAADLQVNNEAYDYTTGSAHYSWLAGVIDNARSSGVPWVVVGMHKNCISAGGKSCEIGAALMNLLVSRKVDLVLQGHDHNYQRSKQLALNPGTCSAVPVDAYDADCVVDDGADDAYAKGAGSLIVVSGTFGRSVSTVNAGDSEAAYFARMNSTTYGFTKFTVSANRIDVRFVNTVGEFTDAFSIGV